MELWLNLQLILQMTNCINSIIFKYYYTKSLYFVILSLTCTAGGRNR